MSKEKWEKKYPGKTPEDQGLLVKTIPVEGRGMVECVLFRLLEADEWDVTVQNAMRSRLTEVVDDGSLMLRAGQQEQKFEALSAATAGSMAAQKGQVVKTLEEFRGADHKPEDENPQDAPQNEEAGADDDSDEDLGVCSSSIAAMFVKSKAALPSRAAAVAKGKAGPKAKANAGSSNKRVLVVVAGGGEPDTKRQKQKAAEQQQDAHDFLMDEPSYKEVYQMGKQMEQQLANEPWSLICVTAQDKAKLPKAAKEMGTTAQAIYTKYVKLSVKLSKRKHISEHIGEHIMNMRDHMKCLQRLVCSVQEKTAVDADGMQQAIESSRGCAIPVPLALASIALGAKIQQAMRLGEVDGFERQFTVILDGADDTSMKMLRAEAIELGLVKMTAVMQKKSGEEFTAYLSAVELLVAAAFDSSNALSAALKEIQALSEDKAYQGILKSFLCSRAYTVMEKHVCGQLEEIATKLGPKFHLRELAKRMGDADCVKDSDWQVMFERHAQKCIDCIVAANYQPTDMKDYIAILGGQEARVESSLLPAGLLALADVLRLHTEGQQCDEAALKLQAIHIEVRCAFALCQLPLPEQKPDDNKFQDFKRIAANIRKNYDRMTSLAEVKAKASEIYECFQDDAQKLDIAIGLYASIDPHKHLFDQSVSEAFTQFSNKFSCSSLACDRRVVLRESLAHACMQLLDAILGKGMEGTRGIKGAHSTPTQLTRTLIGSVHKLRQLIPWSATAGDDQINLEYALHMGTALKHYRLVEKAAETADVDLSTLSPDEFETVLANAAANLGEDYKDAAAAVREIVAPGHDLALARMGWIVSDLGASIAAQAWVWAEQAEKVFTKCSGTLLLGAESNLIPFVRELEATLEGFSVKTKEKAAEAVSKATDKLEQFMNLADATFTDMGLPADVLEPSKRLAHAAHVSTVGWGLHQVSSAAAVDHIVSGKPARDTIRLIMQNYPSIVEKDIPEELRTRVLELCALDGDQAEVADEGEGAADEDVVAGKKAKRRRFGFKGGRCAGRGEWRGRRHGRARSDEAPPA